MRTSQKSYMAMIALALMLILSMVAIDRAQNNAAPKSGFARAAGEWRDWLVALINRPFEKQKAMILAQKVDRLVTSLSKLETKKAEFTSELIGAMKAERANN